MHSHAAVTGVAAPWQAAFVLTGLPGVLIAFLSFLHTDRRPPGFAAKVAENGSDLKSYAATHGRVIAFTCPGFGFAALAFYAVGSRPLPSFRGLSACRRARSAIPGAP